MFRKINLFFSKKIGLVLLVFVLALNPVLAMGKPVMDITSILQTIVQSMQDVKKFTAKLQQWKSDYERLAKAAEALTSGDYAKAMSGLRTIVSFTGGKNIINNNLISGANDILDFTDTVNSWSQVDWQAYADSWSSGGNLYDNLLNGMDQTSALANKIIASSRALSNFERSWNSLAKDEEKRLSDIAAFDTTEKELKDAIKTAQQAQFDALDEGNQTKADQYAAEIKSLEFAIKENDKNRTLFKQRSLKSLNHLKDEAMNYYGVKLAINIENANNKISDVGGWEKFREIAYASSSKWQTQNNLKQVTVPKNK